MFILFVVGRSTAYEFLRVARMHVKTGLDIFATILVCTFYY